MCELFAMSSRFPATVTFSLEEFSRHGAPTGPHKDGWGIAYYEDRDVRLFKEPEPASDSDCVRFIEQHDLRSTLVVSHIRHATQGSPSFRNTQPFSRELAGRMHIFAHNGDLAGIRDHLPISAGRYRPVGDTDSEHAFCVLMDQMEKIWDSETVPPPLERRLEVIASLARTLRILGPANFVYSDGEVLFAHGHRRKQPPGQEIRPPGLHVLRRHCRMLPQALDAEGVTISGGGEEQAVALVASVALTEEDWRPMKEGEIVALASGRIVTRIAD